MHERRRDFRVRRSVDRGLRGGLRVGPEAIYLVEEDTYSETGGLAHELLHVLGHDHPNEPDWAPGSREAKRIEAANVALRGQPDVDRIPAEVVK